MNEMMEVVPLMDSSDEDEDIVSIGSNSTSSTGGKSTFETTFNQEMIAREEEDNLIIDSAIEEYQNEINSEMAIMLDKSTNTSNEIIEKWKCMTVSGPDNKDYHKQSLLKSIFSPSGTLRSQTPSSMDRNSRVMAQPRYGKVVAVGEDTIVKRSFNAALNKMSKGFDPLPDENSDGGDEIFAFDDAVVLLVKAKPDNKSTPQSQLVVGRVKSFGKKSEKNVKEKSMMPSSDLTDYNITVAVEETIEVLTSKGNPGLQITGKIFGFIFKVPAETVIFAKPSQEIFHGSSDDEDAMFARVFDLSDLEKIFDLLKENFDSKIGSACSTVIPPLKVGGKDSFVIQKNTISEDLPMCTLCSPPFAIGKIGLDVESAERMLRNHTARHIMEAAGFGDAMPHEPCGWCGGGECKVKLVNGRGTRAKIVEVECKKFQFLPTIPLSKCKGIKKFPSSNHPFKCPGKCKRIVMSYNFVSHLLVSQSCGKVVSIDDLKVKKHLPFCDDNDAAVEVQNTEKERLRSLFKIQIDGKII